MQKKTSLLVIVILLFVSSYAQVYEVTGTVTTASNFPIRGVKVHSEVDKKSVFTDSSGNFTIPLHMPDNLTVSYDGFLTQKIKLVDTSQSPLAIHLSANSSSDMQVSNDQLKSQALQGSISQTSKFNNSIMYGTGDISGTTFPSFSHKDDTKGSQYLLDDWANGIVKGKNNNIITNSSFVYNYNKTDGSLVMTNDMKTAVTIDNSQVEQFILIPKTGNDSLTFVMQPLIDKTSFVQLLADGKKYQLLKKIKTEFKKANYQTTGLTSSGNNYDEYVDKYTYYIVHVSDNTLTEISLKQKSIKNALPSEADKINIYLSQHNANKFDESEAAKLISYLNQ